MIAFTFPGQGSQSIGMGKDLAEAFPESRQVFEEVNDALGQDLSHIMWAGAEADLMLTSNTQPALLAVSMAVMRALEANGLTLSETVSYVAGHSLGEYSALCAAGMFSIGDAARLLRIRGDAMQAAVPVGEGAMLAIIGLDADQVAAVCAEASTEGPCQIANDNGGGQLVVSGAKSAVEVAARIASDKGAKRAIMLPVSAPFHSSLMQPAAERMREALAAVTASKPVIPVISNVTVTPLSDPDEIMARLVEQVTGRVRWRETVEWFGINGIATLCEIGAGKVLTGLARRINRDIDAISINTPADIETALKVLL